MSLGYPEASRNLNKRPVLRRSHSARNVCLWVTLKSDGEYDRTRGHSWRLHEVFRPTIGANARTVALPLGREVTIREPKY